MQLLQPAIGEKEGQLVVGRPLLLAQARENRGQCLAIVVANVLEQAFDHRYLDVGVATGSERVGERLHPLECLAVALARKAGLEDLHRRAQAASRDPHVVHALGLLKVEHTLRVLEQLVRPHLDDSGSRARKWLAAVDSMDITRPRHEFRLDQTASARPHGGDCLLRT